MKKTPPLSIVIIGLIMTVLVIVGCVPESPKDTRTPEQKAADTQAYYQSRIIVVEIQEHGKACAFITYSGGLFCWDTPEVTP